LIPTNEQSEENDEEILIITEKNRKEIERKRKKLIERQENTNERPFDEIAEPPLLSFSSLALINN
jgi:hypothetical protein